MESDAGSQIRHWHTYLHDMIGNFKSGCSGFIDWNLLLNSEGGPNHQGNLCEAPIQYDAQNDVLRRNHSGMVLATSAAMCVRGEGHAFFKLR